MATFTGTNGADVANAITRQLTGFTGGTPTQLQVSSNIFDGLAGNDTVLAGEFDDTLIGGLDVDNLSGGGGNDVFVVDFLHFGTVEVYDGGDGFDTLRLTLSTPGAGAFEYHFEDDTVASIEAITFAHSNGLLRAFFDASAGLSPNLAVTGSPGFFEFIFVQLTTPGSIDVSGWTFTNWSGSTSLIGSGGADTITGSSQQDSLIGNAGNDTLNGGVGNDSLDGGTGNDVMRGGIGNDIYGVDNAGDQVIENAGEGTADQVRSSFSYTLPAHVENLFLIGSSAINGTGNALNNEINGNNASNIINGLGGSDNMSGADGNDTLLGGPGNDILGGNFGNDILNGGAGNDQMFGGAGDDIFEVDSAGDSVSEGSTEGTDLVRSTISYTLGTNVEHLGLRGSTNINGTGNTLNNFLDGNAGNNTLSGLDGNDVLLGNAGNDTLLGGNGNDELNGGPGNDILVGGDFGAGNDIFSYWNAAEGGDTINFFSSADDTLAFSSAGFGGGLIPGEVIVAGTTFISNGNPIPTTAEGAFLFDTRFLPTLLGCRWDRRQHTGANCYDVKHYRSHFQRFPDRVGNRGGAISAAPSHLAGQRQHDLRLGGLYRTTNKARELGWIV